MKRILVIDDAAFSRRMICKFLKADGYEVLEASSVKDGLEIVQTQALDCLLTDLLMPEINGFEFLQLLQAQDCNIPTIVISADIQDASRDRAYELGAVNFINKPPKEAELQAAVRQVVGAIDR